MQTTAFSNDLYTTIAVLNRQTHTHNRFTAL